MQHLEMPASLQPGDTIAITAPARAIALNQVQKAVEALRHFGYQVKLGATIGHKHYIFGGSDDERLKDFQQLLDDPLVKAIWCARGGYGSVRFVDAIHWPKQAKWLIGFSDITNLHLAAQQSGWVTLHAEMPLRIDQNWLTNESVNQLFSVLKGDVVTHKWNTAKSVKDQRIVSRLYGGNLATLVSNLGHGNFPNLTNNLLFIEEVGEYLYQIDRLLWQLKRSGKADKLAGLVVGDFTNIRDNEDPFDNDVKGLIHRHFGHVPVAFGFKAGHGTHNWPLLLGATYQLESVNGQWNLQPKP